MKATFDTLADALAATAALEAPCESERQAWRAMIEQVCLDVLDGWALPDGTVVSATKGGLATALRCERSLGAPRDGLPGEALIRGTIIDEAASALSISPEFPFGQSWKGALIDPIRDEDQGVAQFWDSLTSEEQNAFVREVSQRCDSLVDILGDFASHKAIAQPSMKSVLVDGRIELRACPDFVSYLAQALIELKAGKGFGVNDDLAFYALVDVLTPTPMSAVGISVATDRDPIIEVTPASELVARGIALLADGLQAMRRIDEAVASNQLPSATAGGHCAWCTSLSNCDVGSSYTFAFNSGKASQ